MILREPITYELLMHKLQSKFKDFAVEIRSGRFEPYVHVKTSYFSVTFNIWYSAKDRTIEITDGSMTYRDRITPIVSLLKPPFWKTFPFEFNRLKRRSIKGKLERYLTEEFSND